MIGNLTIDKASMNISYFLNTIRIISLNGGRISRRDFVNQMAEFIGVSAQKNGKENRTPYNKSKLPRYFGFVDRIKERMLFMEKELDEMLNSFLEKLPLLWHNCLKHCA